MATTAFHPSGYPGVPYGTFAGKEESAAGHNPGRITTLHLGGYPGRLYGSFAGKEASTAAASRITAFHPNGYSGRLYGTFADKEASTPVVRRGRIVGILLFGQMGRRNRIQ